MERKQAIRKENLSLNIDTVASMIVRNQRENGEIPWGHDNKTDPWDLIEAVMGLNIAGYFPESKKAFDWMIQHQLENGSWYASYRNSVPEDKTLDTNMSSYIAVGVFHYYLITRDISFLEKMWPTVRKAINFALNLQAPSGEIHWAISPEGKTDPVALLTGSSSIYMSTKCALAIAKQLNHRIPEWEKSLFLLGDAIRNRRHIFNVTKSRFSMDWFYPILSGALTDDEAHKRIDKHWKKFVVEGLGVRCVSDEPWVTIAETSELVLSLHAMGNNRLAEIVFNWIQDRCFDDGSYWCGFTFPNMVIWPEDKLTWTNGVFLMAADALYNLSPAGQLFSHRFWETSEYSPFT